MKTIWWFLLSFLSSLVIGLCAVEAHAQADRGGLVERSSSPRGPEPALSGVGDAAVAAPTPAARVSKPASAAPSKPVGTPSLSTVEGLLLTLFLALAATSVTVLLRQRASTEALSKPPLGCNPCMSFWSTALIHVAWLVVSGPALAQLNGAVVLWFVTVQLAASGLTFLFLERGVRS